MEEANFPKDEGVSCLLEKVLESVKHDFDKWICVDGWFEKLSGIEYVKINICWCESHTYYGSLFIDDSKFVLNHDACEKFSAVWQEEFGKRDKLKRDAVLKKWGCK